MTRFYCKPESTFMACRVCGVAKNVNHENDFQFAYREINKFRGEHEKCEIEQRRKKYHSK